MLPFSNQLKTFGVSCCLATCMMVSLATAQSEMPAVFVTNNAGDSVSSFTVNADGSLNFVQVVPTSEGPQTITLTPNGRFLAVGHGTAAEDVEILRIFEVLPDATLIEAGFELIPNSPLNAKWLDNDTLAVTETSLTGPNNLLTYELDSEDGDLTFVDSQFIGDFSYNIALTRSSSLVYVNNTFGTRSIYAISADSSGNLEQIENEVISPLFVVAVEASPDGDFLYGAGGISGTGNEIVAFEIAADGSLTAIPGAQSPGQSPKVIGINGDGTILVAGHGSDSTIQSFIRDPKTGLISPTGFFYDVGSQGNLGDLVVMGNRMYVTDESTTDDGLRGLLSFDIHSDGSFTQNGSIVDTQGARPEYIAAWAGAPAFLLGDVNRDGVVDLLDVSAFLDLLTSGQYQVEADINGDGAVNLLDVAGFVELLVGN